MTLEALSEKDLNAFFRRKYADPTRCGWRVRMHLRFGYFSSQTWYEAIVDRLVKKGSKWIDVGGGRALFPHNKALSKELSDRCGLLVGVDPSNSIGENRFVHQAVQVKIEDFRSEEVFDLATLRMVAEHIENPILVAEALSRLVKPGGHAVIYTPHRWSVASMAATLIPDKLHSFFTSLLWDTKAEDVFPTFYRMNTRKQLAALFNSCGFFEIGFAYLANCATLQRFRLTCFAELCLWKLLHSLHIYYPENDLLAVYERSALPNR